MPTVDLVLTGFSINTSQTSLGLCTVSLIRGKRNILVDVGHYGRRRLLVEGLAKAGLRPEDIQLIILTHSHWDHAQTLDIFPNAQFVVHPAELDYSRAPRKGDFATPAYFTNILQGLSVIEVRDNREIDPGVRIMETPGHTKGHISVLVETPTGPVCVGGDAFTTAATGIVGKPRNIFWSEAEAEQSIQRIRKSAPVIFPGHDLPFRVGADGRGQYLIPTPTFRVLGQLPASAGGFGINIDAKAGPIPVSAEAVAAEEAAIFILPEAKKRA